MMHNWLRRWQIQIMTFLAIAISATVAQGQLPSFPGAEGFGTTTPGGRGGRIIEVTNLNPSGPGSFRAACDAAGPRIVVFRVGGVITLEDALTIKEPYITIAGQTAPGDGIAIRGASLWIDTHDVIVRGLRVRIGDAVEGVNPADRDALDIVGHNAPHNVVIDHCSLSWAIDENVSLWYPGHDITIQWSIISEGLHKSLHPKGPHSTGLLVGPGQTRVTIHHNLMAHNNGRNPLFCEDTKTELINNVIYNWGSWGATDLGRLDQFVPAIKPMLANVIGNYYRPGINSGSHPPIRVWSGLASNTRFYMHGNVVSGQLQEKGNNWQLVKGMDIDPTPFRVETPAVQPSGVITHQAPEAYDLVLSYAGAIAPKRDRVDKRIVQSVRDRTGSLINSQNDVGGWPIYQSALPPPDADHDGMPDDWETAHGLNPKHAGDRNGIAPSGYTWIEEYINSLIPLPTDNTRPGAPSDLRVIELY